MFLTESHARHPVMSALAGEDQHVWTYVNLTINRPWFFAMYSLRLPEGEVGETVLLSSVDQVSQLLGQESDAVEVRQLMLISPGHVNHGGNWRMEPLHEIWRGRVADRSDQVLMYQLADGRRYIEGHWGDAELPQLSDLTCLASFPA